MDRSFSYQKMFAAILVLFLTGCERVSDRDRIPPDPPVIVPASAGISPVEQGIDAIPDWDWIHLEWWVGSEEDLAGYEIYRRMEGEFVDSLVAVLLIQEISGDVAAYEDEEVALRKRYFYTIKAFDEANNASTASDTLTFRLLSKVIPDQPRGDITGRIPEFVFQWGDDAASIIYYLVKVKDVSDNYLWISDPEQGIAREYENPGSMVYNADGTAASDSLDPGVYYWRVDAIGTEEYSESESRWTRFVVQ
ncbi:MAG: hypothetical protein V1800_06805 [Candidatus Latescibacterota bacterium]